MQVWDVDPTGQIMQSWSDICGVYIGGARESSIYYMGERETGKGKEGKFGDGDGGRDRRSGGTKEGDVCVCVCMGGRRRRSKRG
jgi:hypothetical protein